MDFELLLFIALIVILLMAGLTAGLFRRSVHRSREIFRLKNKLDSLQAEYDDYKGFLYHPPPEPVASKASETALLIVDMQESWCELSRDPSKRWKYDPQVLPVIQNVKKLLKAAHELGIPVIYVHWPGDPIYEPIGPREEDLVLLKEAPGVFSGPHAVSAYKSFEKWEKKHPNIKQIIVTGTVVNWCVLNTAHQIRWLHGESSESYSLVLPQDAISGLTLSHSPQYSRGNIESVNIDLKVPLPNGEIVDLTPNVNKPSPTIDYTYWWLWFADGGGEFGPSTTKITQTDLITFN